jgi:hypothetical protein
MRANPEPLDSLWDNVAEGSIMVADSCGPDCADSLKVERRMARIGLQKAVVLVRQLAHFLRESVV